MELPKYSNEIVVRPDDEVTAVGMLLNETRVAEWEEGGYKWHINKIPKRLVGASVRNYQLFCNDEPAAGGMYHTTIGHAKERAHFVAQGSMSNQITYLWRLVHEYRQKLERAGITP